MENFSTSEQSFDYDKYNWVETNWPSFSFTPQRKVTSVYIKRYPYKFSWVRTKFFGLWNSKVASKESSHRSSIFCWFWFTYAACFVLYVLRYVRWNSWNDSWLFDQLTCFRNCFCFYLMTFDLILFEKSLISFQRQSEELAFETILSVESCIVWILGMEYITAYLLESYHTF